MSKEFDLIKIIMVSCHKYSTIDCPSITTTINFDDLSSGVSVPNGYNNMNWTSASCHAGSSTSGGYVTATVSSPNSIFNAFAAPMTIASTTGCTFTLLSAAVAAAWNDNLQLRVVGYFSGTIVASHIYTLQVFSISNLAFNGFSGIDHVIFTSSGGTKNPSVTSSGTHFAMDDLQISYP